MKVLVRYLVTIYYLKPSQLWFQILHRLKRYIPFTFNKAQIYSSSIPKAWKNTIHANEAYFDNNYFRFLNQGQNFGKTINWDFSEYGKLWTYHLNYFDFLNQGQIASETGLDLIYAFIRDYDKIKTGKEPYPTSLRIINWIKFLSANQIKDSKIQEILSKDISRLTSNPEYHLLGNHLLENGLALFFASVYFDDDGIYLKAQKILLRELREQILDDGGHFELSPMYHQILLFRILDCIAFAKLNQWNKDPLLLKLFHAQAKKMAEWLEIMTFNYGEIPLFNDSTKDVAPSTSQILKYVAELGIQIDKSHLSDSGYRKVEFPLYEMFVDIGNIKASYQPGHTHADTFGFVLNIKNKPFLVDTGISTYNLGERRNLERSTASHNTVSIGLKNSSDVWAGFRVGKRANVIIQKDSEREILAEHNGYGMTVQRKWESDFNQIIITDTVHDNDQIFTAHFHFDPLIDIQLIENRIKTHQSILHFDNSLNITIESYMKATAFNKLEASKKVLVNFKSTLITRIKIHE